MTNLRNAAQGEPCMVRSLVCNFDPQTTVLAHYRLIGVSGIGTKSPDLIGAWACSACHDLVDGRAKTELSKNDLRLMHLHGVIRTQAELIRRGIVITRRGRHVESTARVDTVPAGEAPLPKILPRRTASTGRAVEGQDTVAATAGEAS